MSTKATSTSKTNSGNINRSGSGGRPPRVSKKSTVAKEHIGSTVCNICNKTFTGKTGKVLECERCCAWFCAKCINLRDAEHSVMARHDCHWFCSACQMPALQAVLNEKLVEDKCREFLRKFEQRLENVEKEMSQKASKQDLQKLDTKVKSLEEKMDSMCSSQAETQNVMRNTANQAANEGIKELEDRDARKENLITFGVKESESPESEIRKNEDLKKAEDICKRGLDMQVDIKDVRRMGKKETSEGTDSKPRPMLVKLKSQQEVTNALSATKKLRQHEDRFFHTINLKRDMTPLERGHMRDLVIQRNRKREESKPKGEETLWVIRGNRIINIARQTPTRTGEEAKKD